MLRRLLIALALALAVAAACSLDADVEHEGEYAFFGSGPKETDARPLSELLIIEQDTTAGEVLCTLFRGELGRAGVGLDDLRQIARGHGPFQMVFDPPQSRRAARVRELLEDDASERITVALDGLELDLVRIDGDALGAVGASRWLRTLDSRDFRVEAYVGVAALEAPLRAITVDGHEHALGARLAPVLDDPEVMLDESEESLRVSYAPLVGPDYLRLDLWQPLERFVESDDDAGVDDPMPDAGVDDGKPDAGTDAGMHGDGGVREPEPDIREAMVRNTLSPESDYEASFALLTDAFGQGCWSLEHPLRFRLTQIARDYESRDGGDLAVIHLHAEHFPLADAQWQPAIDEPEPAGYCESYRPAP